MVFVAAILLVMSDFSLNADHAADASGPASMLAGRRLVLGVTGGIAAYKAAELTRLLIQDGATLEVVLTDAATRFVGEATFQALSGRPVWLDLWDGRGRGMAHIDLTRQADAVLVVPATADFLARLAQGRADDLLAALCLARPATCPLIVAPAMNREMWAQPATQRNVAQLLADGVTFIGPDRGAQACGEEGEGRMSEPAAIAEALSDYFVPKRLAGRRVLLTAGPTFEALDPVRGLTNPSSGRMGHALARACRAAGAEVCLIRGPVDLPPPAGVEVRSVISALQMRAAVFDALPGCDVFIAVAAVADWRPKEIAPEKLKKGAPAISIELVANPDILAEVAVRPDAPFCVGFAAESERLTEHAEAKRRAKKLPLIVGNLVGDALGKPTNRVVLFDDNGAHPLPEADKLTVAHAIVAHLARLLEKTPCTASM